MMSESTTNLDSHPESGESQVEAIVPKTPLKTPEVKMPDVPLMDRPYHKKASPVWMKDLV